MRNIDDILNFREDISPFLVHLTRRTSEKTASQVLEDIIAQKKLRAGPTEVSDAHYLTYGMMPDERKRFFNAICLTETPLNEIHCLLEIANRQVELEPYGLVFLKDKLRKKGVAPVLYLNNELEDQLPVFKALFGLKDTAPDEAELVLPLLSVFGKKLRAEGEVDWLWEREWRYPNAKGPLGFTKDDVFVGICPDAEIDAFQRLFSGVGFIDPMRNMKWYANKLIEARQRCSMEHSVV